MIRSSPTISLLITFYLFLLVRSGGERPFLPNIDKGDVKGSIQRPPSSVVRTQSRLTPQQLPQIQVQPTQPPSTEVFSSSRFPVKGVHQSDLGLSQSNGNAQTEVKNDNQSSVVFTQHRHLVKPKANTKEKDVANTKNPVVKNFQEENSNGESDNDDINTKTKTETNMDSNADRETHLQNNHRFYRHRQPPQEKPATNQGSRNNLLVTTENEGPSGVGESLVDTTKKPLKLGQNPGRRIVIRGKDQQPKDVDAGTKSTLRPKNEPNTFPTPLN